MERWREREGEEEEGVGRVEEICWSTRAGRAKKESESTNQDQ